MGDKGGHRVLFRYYRGGPWLCKDERACYSRCHLAWAVENFAENERVRFRAAIARRKAEIAREEGSPVKPRWRIQALGRHVAYEPRFFVTAWAARRQIARLERSFAAGDVRIVRERVANGNGKAH